MTSKEKNFLKVYRIHKERLAAKKAYKEWEDGLKHRYLDSSVKLGVFLVGRCQCDACRDLARRFRLGDYGQR